MTKTKKLKDWGKKKLRKMHKGISAAIENSNKIDIQQLTVVSNEIKKPIPSLRDNCEKSINFGKGLDYIYDKRPVSSQAGYSENLNPFALSLQKIRLNTRETNELSRLKSAIVIAKNPSELNEAVDEAISNGIRMNGYHEKEWSFAEYVILGMHLHKFKKGDQKKIIRKLMLRGAEFHDILLQNELVGEIYNELQPEVQPQINKQLEDLRKVGENAIQRGSIISVEIDDKISLTEFSENSTIEVAKVIEGTRNLGLNRGNIIKMGNNEFEVRSEAGGVRNYIDVSNDSIFEITFPTSIGGLRMILFHKAEDDHRVQVRVIDTGMWAELQKNGEKVGENCLFGGTMVKEAVERGSFTRCGIWSEGQAIKEIKEVNETLSSWVDRIHRGSKEIFRER